MCRLWAAEGSCAVPHQALQAVCYAGIVLRHQVTGLHFVAMETIQTQNKNCPCATEHLPSAYDAARRWGKEQLHSLLFQQKTQ